MKKNILAFFIINFILICSISAFSQNRSKAKPKQNKAPVENVQPPQPTNADAILEKKIAAALLEAEDWKEQTFAAENFKVLFPRRAVKYEEAIYDDSIGKINLINYLGVGDNGVFSVGTFPMPYTITDENVLREIYNQAVKDILPVEEYQVAEAKEIKMQGKSAMEIIGVSVQDKNEKAVMRLFLSGKNVFYVLAMPIIPENKSEHGNLRNRAKFEKEKSIFLDSFIELPGVRKVASEAIPAVFESSYTDGVFHSEYFNFTLQIPKDWVEIPQNDVETIGESGKEVIKANSDLKITAKNVRRNLFYFALKPLGAEKNATISCNLLKQQIPATTPYIMSKMIEQELGKVKLFAVTRATDETTLGAKKFVGFEAKGKINDEEFQETIYFTSGKDYIINFTMIYYDEEQRKKLLQSLASINFKE